VNITDKHVNRDVFVKLHCYLQDFHALMLGVY
jgi:hypothetical protein